MFKHSIFKIFLLATGLLMSTGMWAGAGFWGDGASTVRFSVNGQSYDVTLNNSEVSPVNLGSVHTLSVSEWWYKMWQNATEINNDQIAMHYRIYSVNGTPGNFATSWGSYVTWGDWTNGTQNPQFGKTAANIDLLSGLTAGEYTFEYYFTGKINNNLVYLNNGNGSNYKIRFTIHEAVASNELFGTYQEHDAILWETNWTNGRKLGVDYYIATCGQTVLLRAKANGSTTFDGNGWATQLRVKNGGQVEIQAQQVASNKNHYTGSGSPKTITSRDEDLTMHFFAFCNGQNHRLTPDFTFGRHMINAPIDDQVAPTLDVENTTIDDSGENIVVTFGQVTADDEYFYYVADKEHNIAAISLDNSITIAKPTDEDGKTYNFICCAVDYNGNMSAAKQYSYTDTFNPDKNIALNKPSQAGTQQGDGVKAPKANNGNESDFWTCYGTGTSDQWWWSVDLGDNYDVNRVRILFNDRAGSFQILSSVDGNDWTVYASEASGYPVDITYNTLASARYFKFVSTHANVGIKEFEVYGIGIHTEDTEAPVLTAANVDNETISDNTAKINVTATDNVAVATCHLVDNANNFDETFDFNGGVIVLTNLTHSTTYTFTVTVADLAGNVSAALTMDQITTKTNTNIPAQAAPTPNHDANDVINVYCTQYGGKSVVETANAGWNWQYTSKSEETLFSTMHYFVEDCGTFGLKPSTSVSGMDYLHVDLWAKVDMNGYVLIEGINIRKNFTISAGEWTSIDVEVTGKTPNQNWIQIYLGTDGDHNGKKDNVNLYVTNVYFWKNKSYTRTVATAGRYGTICLPRAVENLPQTAYFYEATSVENGSLNVKKVSALEAGKAYIYAPQTTDNLVFLMTGEEAEADQTGIMVGNLSETPIALTDQSNAAVLSNNKIYYLGSGSTASIAQYKAYFKGEGFADAQAGAPIRIVDMTDTATDCEQLQAERIAVKMMINGQLFIQTENGLFDVMGRKVN